MKTEMQFSQCIKNNTVPDMEARLRQIHTAVKEKTVSLAEGKKRRQEEMELSPNAPYQERLGSTV